MRALTAARALRTANDGPHRPGEHRVLDALTDKLPKVAEHLDTGRADVLPFTAFPKEA